MEADLQSLGRTLEGEIRWDWITRTAYATDASIYREIPEAVAFPAVQEDIRTLIAYANQYRLSLIPRGAGTSLAGQVVGPGIVVDVSRFLNRILEINTEERTAWVEPGVVLDDLNRTLAHYGLFFGPETSTANRCVIGGMVGNNACGLHSLVYGSTRDHTLAIRAILSDGSEVEFSDLSGDEFEQKCALQDLEGHIYREIRDILSDPLNRSEIRDKYPDPGVPRRNTGYALDQLLDCVPFVQDAKPFNMCRLLAGSEGTLTFFTAIKINLVELPPAHKALICVHCSSLTETLEANLVALSHTPTAVELMDRIVLDSTRTNHTQEANRFFLTGDPRAILIIEFAQNDPSELKVKVEETIAHLTAVGLGYAYPVITGPDIRKVWDLRKAGLGSLANIPGDPRAVTVIEDIAVPVDRLVEYVADMEALFAKLEVSCVYHAHVGTGELHLRPVLNLKDPADLRRFRTLAEESVQIVKKYRGSLSGEHGDGRLRAGLIPLLLGQHNHDLIRRTKVAFDANNLFNPGKIVDAPPMDSFLRNEPGQPTPEISTVFDFSDTLGIVRAAEKCNGSADCRKSQLSTGAMCPSYQATLNENNSTRARANILREYLLKPSGKNRFDHPEIYEVMDLCLSCKACKSECPSNVDITRLKAEFLQQWYDIHGVGLRTRIIANLPAIYNLTRFMPRVTNAFMRPGIPSRLLKRLLGFHGTRSMPLLADKTLVRQPMVRQLAITPSSRPAKDYVYLLADEFTNHLDVEIGIKAILLLTALGYPVRITGRMVSGRTYLSKGLLRQARQIVRKNILKLHPLVSKEHPLLGVEPSALLGFRDEYPLLAGEDLKSKALDLASNALMIEEFLEREMRVGRIVQEDFTREKVRILLHGHCQQKAVSSTKSTLFVLQFPENYSCSEIPSGCCGMAGAFGFEKEHYDLSVKVGELVLFPAVRAAEQDVLICAPGTSCRHQIIDGTGRQALHPVEILFNALHANS